MVRNCPSTWFHHVEVSLFRKSEDALKKEKSPLFTFNGRENWIYETGKSEIIYSTPFVTLEDEDNYVPHYRHMREEEEKRVIFFFGHPRGHV